MLLDASSSQGTAIGTEMRWMKKPYLLHTIATALALYCLFCSASTLSIAQLARKQSQMTEFVTTPFINTTNANDSTSNPHIAIIGSGNWGTAVARRLGLNLLHKQQNSIHTSHQNDESFKRNTSEKVKMWVFEERVHGEKLSEIINLRHENVKYLPNISLPENLLAVPDLLESCYGANLLFFVVPHQFLANVLKQLKGHVHRDTICVSLIKGIDCLSHAGEVKRFSEIIKEELGVRYVAAIMGANVANDVAKDEYVETTVASEELWVAEEIAKLMECSCLRTEVTDDLATVEFSGAIKNVIALGAGFCDGLGMGSSTKAALIRQGLEEMALFCRIFDRTKQFKKDTLLLSCGVADVIATCYGGRNRLCSEEFARLRLSSTNPHPRHHHHHHLHRHHSDNNQTKAQSKAGSGIATVTEQENNVENEKDGHGNRATSPREEVKKLWEEIETRLLHGQKLQGVSTCEEVVHLLSTSELARQHLHEFPLIRRIHEIAVEGKILPLWDTDR